MRRWPRRLLVAVDSCDAVSVGHFTGSMVEPAKTSNAARPKSKSASNDSMSAFEAVEPGFENRQAGGVPAEPGREIRGHAVTSRRLVGLAVVHQKRSRALAVDGGPAAARLGTHLA